MATANSTRSTRNNSNVPSAALLEAAGNLCCNLQPFFDLMEHEVKHHNSTDFDNVEFLVKGAKAEVHQFSKLIFEIEEATASSSRKGGEA